MNIHDRNRIVEQHLWCIDNVMRQNRALIRDAHLDREDVYQSLAMRMIRAVERYDETKGRSLKGYLCDQMKYELLDCAGPRARHGLVDAPYHIRDAVISMEIIIEDGTYFKGVAALG